MLPAVFVYVPLLLLAGSAAALLFALRGRRVDDHPYCRKCGFDLFGKPAAATIGDRQLEAGPPVARPRSMQANLPDDREAAYDLGPVLTELTDGPKTVKQTFSFQVYESWPPWGRPLAVGSADVAAAWVLVPTDRPTVAVDPEPSRRSVVEAAVAVADMTVDGQTASLTVEAMRPPIDLAYDVILSADGRQWPAGSVRFRAGKVAAHCLAVRARGLTADRVAVVLRPNAAEAAGTVDMTRVWGGEVRVRDVSVKRLSAAGEGGSGGSQ